MVVTEEDVRVRGCETFTMGAYTPPDQWTTVCVCVCVCARMYVCACVRGGGEVEWRCACGWRMFINVLYTYFMWSGLTA